MPASGATIDARLPANARVPWNRPRVAGRLRQPAAMSSAISTMTLAWRTEAMSISRPL